MRHELEAYGEELGDKTEILALNKIDALDDETRAAKAAELEAAVGRQGPAGLRRLRRGRHRAAARGLRPGPPAQGRGGRRGDRAERRRARELGAVSGIAAAKRIVVKVGSALLIGPGRAPTAPGWPPSPPTWRGCARAASRCWWSRPARWRWAAGG